jgi:hypothetical protein
MSTSLMKQENCGDDNAIKILLLSVLRENNVSTSSTHTTTVYINTRKEICSDCTKELHPACFEKESTVRCFQVNVLRGCISFQESNMHPTLPMHAVKLFLPLFIRLDGVTPSELVFYIIKRAVEIQNVENLVTNERIHYLQNQIVLGKTTVHESVQVLTDEAKLTSEQRTQMEIVADAVRLGVHVSSKICRLLQNDSVSSAFQFVANYLDAQLKTSILKSAWMEMNATLPFAAEYNKAVENVFAFMVWVQTNMSLGLLESKALQLSDAILDTVESFRFLINRFDKLGAVAWFASLSMSAQRDVLNAYHVHNSARQHIA